MATIYVDTNTGNDANDGTSGSPVETLSAAVALASSGDTILLVDGSSTGDESITSWPENATLACETALGSTIQRLVASNCVNLTIDGVKFENSNPTSIDPVAFNAYALYVAGESSSVSIENCEFDCETGSLFTRLGGIKSDGIASTTVDSCYFHHIQDGVVVNNGTAYVTNCDFDHFTTDCITGVRTDWMQVEDNSATFKEGPGGKILGGAVFTGTINADDWVQSGSGDTLVGGKVVEVGSDWVKIDYNTWEIPPSSGELFVYSGGSPTGASFTYTSRNTSYGGELYDGIHSDFFQPLNNDATRSYILGSIKRNWLYRSTDAAIEELDVEENAQGFLLADNNGDPELPWLVGTIEHNVLVGNMSVALQCVNFAPYNDEGFIQFNTVPTGPHSAADAMSRIRVGNSTNITVRNNVSDLVVDNGGNVGCTFRSNAEFGRDQYTTEFPSMPLDTDILDDLAYFVPASDSTTEAAFAGAYDFLGNLRSAENIPVETGIGSVYEGAVSTGASSGTGTLSNVASDGSTNQYLLIAVMIEDSVATPKDISGVTWDGDAVPQLVNAVSSDSYMRLAVFGMPIGEVDKTGDIVVTFATTLSSKGAIVGAVIRSNVDQESTAATINNSPGNTYPDTGTVTVTGTGEVLGVRVDGTSGSSAISAGPGMTELVRLQSSVPSGCLVIGSVGFVGASESDIDLTYSGPAGGTRGVFAPVILQEAFSGTEFNGGQRRGSIGGISLFRSYRTIGR